MIKTFPLLFIIFHPLSEAVITYTISSSQQTNEYGQKDCMGVTRNGIRIHDLRFDDDQTRMLSYPTLCCADYYLRFSRSSLPILATSSFGTRPNYVVDIMMNNTNISKILPGTFAGLNYLNCLDLSQNNISFIQYGIFNGLQRLYMLNLANNNIKQIFDNAFDKVPLKTLFLQDNMLSFLDDNLFSSQKTSLKTINLAKNILKEINNTFIGMNALITLNLNENYITDINLGNIYCSEIYLRKNKISHIGAIRKSIRIMDLSENNIRMVEKLGNSLINASIVKLNLSQNSIQLNQNTFLGLHNLTHLHLDNNKIGNISNTVFRDLKSLIFLDLSHNNISNFQYGTFDHVINMQYLNISYNEFKNLQMHIISPLQKLSELDFRKNRIEKLDIESFYYHCSSVRKIDLNENFWKCKELTNIVKFCQKKSIEVVRGNSFDLENVRGISCVNDDFVVNSTVPENAISEVVQTEKMPFDDKFMENSSFFRFFGEDFQKSNFYEYLENLVSRKQIDPIDLNSTSFYKFFNKDYKNSNLFKYLENLKFIDNTKVTETPVEYFHYLFIFGVTLVAILVLIFITVFATSLSIFKKQSSKSTRTVSNQDNVELL
ncbi:uncharacterized protein [Leptinotarsa decemlineata]|uniref:uncharacterized protein n=1 Tax=Leptinotarsa decemlineata TaxID=7539 RepID=UPI003D30C7ED